MQVDPTQIIKRGLNVRIAIVSGTAEQVRVGPENMRLALIETVCNNAMS